MTNQGLTFALALSEAYERLMVEIEAAPVEHRASALKTAADAAERMKGKLARVHRHAVADNEMWDSIEDRIARELYA